MADDLDPVALEEAFLAAAEAAANDDSMYLAFLRAYLKALWRPIKDAPKDGREMLLAGGVFYHDNDGSYNPVEYSHSISIGHWQDAGWWIGRGETYDDEIWAEPTHFAPLLPAPSHD